MKYKKVFRKDCINEIHYQIKRFFYLESLTNHLHILSLMELRNKGLFFSEIRNPIDNIFYMVNFECPYRMIYEHKNITQSKYELRANAFCNIQYILQYRLKFSLLRVIGFLYFIEELDKYIDYRKENME